MYNVHVVFHFLLTMQKFLIILPTNTAFIPISCTYTKHLLHILHIILVCTLSLLIDTDMYDMYALTTQMEI